MRARLARGQPDLEGGPLPHRAADADAASVLADDAFHDHQSETGAFFLGGVERLENVVQLLLRNAAAGVGDADPDSVGRLTSGRGESAAAGHGLHGILDQVDQDLFDLAGVDAREFQLAGQLFLDVDAAILQFRAQEVEGVAGGVVKRRHLELRRAGPDGLQELSDDVIQPADFAFGHAEVLFELLSGGPRVAFDGRGAATGGHRGLAEFRQFARHQLQMDVEGV